MLQSIVYQCQLIGFSLTKIILKKKFNFNEFKNNEIELKFIFKDVEQWLQDYIFYEIMSIKIFFNDCHQSNFYLIKLGPK